MKKKKSLRMSWSRRKKRWPWLLEDWNDFCATGFGRKKEFAVKKSRFGVGCSDLAVKLLPSWIRLARFN